MAAPPSRPRGDGEYLLHLLLHGSSSSAPPPPPSSPPPNSSPWHLLDPAVAALGPSHPLPPDPLLSRRSLTSFSEIFHPYQHFSYIPPPFPSHAGVFNPPTVQDVPWPRGSFGPLTESVPRSVNERVSSGSTAQEPSFSQFGCNGVEIDENLKGSHSAPCVGQSPSNRSPFEWVSLPGQEAFRPAFAVPSKGSLDIDHGCIGPSNCNNKPFPWNIAEERLGDGWAPTRAACGSKERKCSSNFELCEYKSAHRTKSEVLESPSARVPEAAGDSSCYGAGTGIQGDGMLTDSRSQRRGYQVIHDLPSPTVGWEGWNATRNDSAHLANYSTSQEDNYLDASRWNDSESLVKHLDLEDMRGIGTQNKTKYGGQIGHYKTDRFKSGVNNSSSRNWVATSREKNDAEDGVSKVEAADRSEFGLPERAGKSSFGLPEAALPVNCQEGITALKPRDGPKRRNQQWRLKQSFDANHISPGYMDSGSKPKDSLQKNFIIKNPRLYQRDHVELPSGTSLDSAPGSATEESKQALQAPLYIDRGKEASPALMEPAFNRVKENGILAGLDGGEEEDEEVILGCVGFLDLDNDSEADERKCSVPKPGGSLASTDFGSEVVRDELPREVDRQIITRFHKREVLTRLGMEKCTGQLLSVFQTLIPSEDEELRRKQLLSSLEELVSKKWPEARLYLFGSCANTFGVCNSDIDVCLSIDGQHTTKPELVLRLADMLEANHMQKVQALTHARVPIVKYSDPTTGISCDVCVNNMLAVVNTKLLHDYAQIDVRLRQLAFIVKHWAKCRQVNETYRGTLSSYAYVLMCIHFLQQRKPAVLPCLQEMEPTYQVTVGNIKCAYYDQVGKLKNFGSRNKETLGELLTSFFEYWAFRHDYSHSVISIRTGGFISKIEKDWTRRIGNERHLICIEDPFEISHDLGRVVDKHSIRFLREEFQRAAKVMRHHSNPCVALFEPYRQEKS